MSKVKANEQVVANTKKAFKMLIEKMGADADLFFDQLVAKYPDKFTKLTDKDDEMVNPFVVAEFMLKNYEAQMNTMLLAAEMVANNPELAKAMGMTPEQAASVGGVKSNVVAMKKKTETTH